jgi:hypothetical protein
MAKNPKSFRLSDKATENLRWLVDASGANETAVTELALAFLRQGFYSFAEPSPEELLDIPPEPKELVAIGSVDRGRGETDQKRKRKRKRH